ncbi:hypothetical protein CVT26_015935 [Gymnopilus dilepis]|uniref:Alpha/beta hydrolase fold-3 domain-containing protein n=1 Tax=Gymnopilus dilepis TaxID=231916 RepID=A0A409XYK1_9AGAR|nr:hypothetical protein CVT26_015935 [Gymnopilus dilepis]
MTKGPTLEERNRLSFWDKVKFASIIARAPFALAWSLLTAPFSSYGRAKSWKRILADKLLFTVITSMNRRQARVFFGTTRAHYDNFLKDSGLRPVEESIGTDAKLLWIGPKRDDRVLLYLHGGGFILPMPGAAPAFWRYIQENLEKRGKPTGVAILEYALIPDSPFPTQLKQSIVAIQHLLDSGVKPENIQLVGDSAGGVLIHAILMHMQHPLEGIPRLELSAPLGGGFMLSLWAKLLDKDRCLYTNDGNGDFLNGRTLHYWGSKVMDGVPRGVVPYLEPNSAPEDWFEGSDRHIKRLLITAGEVEALRDVIVKYATTIKKYHKDTTFIIQDNGAHSDPFTDFFVKERTPSKLTLAILNWIYEGFSEIA